jgi:hypothetical protein
MIRKKVMWNGKHLKRIKEGDVALKNVILYLELPIGGF